MAAGVAEGCEAGGADLSIVVAAAVATPIRPPAAPAPRSSTSSSSSRFISALLARAPATSAARPRPPPSARRLGAGAAMFERKARVSPPSSLDSTSSGESNENGKNFVLRKNSTSLFFNSLLFGLQRKTARKKGMASLAYLFFISKTKRPGRRRKIISVHGTKQRDMGKKARVQGKQGFFLFFSLLASECLRKKEGVISLPLFFRGVRGGTKGKEKQGLSLLCVGHGGVVVVSAAALVLLEVGVSPSTSPSTSTFPPLPSPPFPPAPPPFCSCFFWLILYFCRWLATFSLDRPSTFIVCMIALGTAERLEPPAPPPSPTPGGPLAPSFASASRKRWWSAGVQTRRARLRARAQPSSSVGSCCCSWLVPGAVALFSPAAAAAAAAALLLLGQGAAAVAGAASCCSRCRCASMLESFATAGEAAAAVAAVATAAAGAAAAGAAAASAGAACC